MKKIVNLTPKKPIQMLTVKKNDINEIKLLVDTMGTSIARTGKGYSDGEYKLYKNAIRLFRKYGIEACVIRAASTARMTIDD